MANTAGVGLLRDRISNLPDSILVTILSSLPIDEAARCSILASSWRHLFPSTLLDFKVFTSSGKLDIIKAVTAILAAHPTAPVRSFTTGELFFRRPEDKGVVDGWLRDLSNRGIEELSLCFRSFDDIIPDSLSACSSLKRLHATGGTFRDATKAAAATLARLTEINLSRVKISKDSLNSLLSRCVVLEHLTMNGDLDSLHLRSRSLKVLKNSGEFKKLFIDDAPNLERMLDRYMPQRKVHIKVTHAPKLEFLGYLGMPNKIEIGDTSFTEESIHVKTLMPSIKTLAVDLSCDRQGNIKEGYIDWLMQLLKVFPRLETLYIKSSSWSGARDAVFGSWEMQRPPVPCIDTHLEKVVFQVYRGHEWQREMAKFLHRRSRFLKTMEFHCMDDSNRESFSTSEEWVRVQKELLCLDSSAARDASFLFFKSHMAFNHFEICDDEQYQKYYYDDLYFNESVLCGQSWRA